MKILFFNIGPEDIRALFIFLKECKERLFVPRVRSGKVGILIALRTESDKEQLRLRHDLVSNLRQDLNSAGINSLFHVICLSPKLCVKIVDHESASKYLARARGHLIIHGMLIQRKSEDKVCYVFRLNGLVRHRPIALDFQKLFGREFTEMLPRTIRFDEAQELLGFELTEDLLHHVIQYIVGIASLLSGDLRLSYDLFKRLDQSFRANQEKEFPPNIEEMRKRIRFRLIEVLVSYMNAHYACFIVTLDKNIIGAMKPYLDELGNLDAGNYPGHLMRAIYFFYFESVDAAIHELGDIREKDRTWLYSLGFLRAFKGETDAAWDCYKKAFSGDVAPNVINDCEVFISEVIRQHPEKTQLTYFRGLLNLKAKGDRALAATDFEEFLKNDGPSKFPHLVPHAEKYLREIK